MKLVIQLVLTILLATEFVHAAETSTSLTFERDVRPILKARCFQCHGEDGKKEGELDLRLARFMIAGGDSGPAIVPGKPSESYLLDRLHLGEMPPGGDVERPSDEEIDRIERWIAGGAETARPEPEEIASGAYITEEERQFWSFQPIKRPPVPELRNKDRVRTPVDSYLLAKLEEHGATFADEADRQKLLRRVYFDLIGLPPSPEEVDAFLSDDSPAAYERLIDRLLESPHYGERWGRHWLDTAGYADSEGAENDDIRPYAYRYRDYVIHSFNDDKPFDQFIREQLAGDEMVGSVEGDLTPEQAEKLIATGFLQMAPDHTGSAEDLEAAHNQLVADTLEIVSTSLLGLTVGCARCHDHRYDPISQDDYYRFRAIFEPALSRPNWQGKARQVSWITDFDKREAELAYERQRQGVVLRAVEDQLKKLPEAKRAAAREAYETPDAERSEEQQRLLVNSKLNITFENIEDLDRRATQELNRLANFHKSQQQRIGFLQAIQESGARARTFLFVRGDPAKIGREVRPGELTILAQQTAATIPENDPALSSSGRRLAYANHLTDGAHPLVARVIVNRVWMHHFGQGICRTPTDLGMEGDKPSHPDLFDWLASEFMDSGWSLKHLHKLIMTSSAYRQGARRTEELKRIDPDNRLLGGFKLRRLEAEIVRDSMLAVSGDLNPKPFGQPIPVRVDPAGEIVIGVESLNAGIPVAVVPMFGEEHRRSIYVQSRRSMPLTFMEMFDAPQMEPNCKARTTSTVAPQSLVLMNSPFIHRQSMSFAERVREKAGNDLQQQVKLAWKLALSRKPTDEETADAVAFLTSQAKYFREHPLELAEPVEVPGSRSQIGGPQVFDLLIEAASAAGPETLALAQLCQMLMSSNEFLYVG